MKAFIHFTNWVLPGILIIVAFSLHAGGLDMCTNPCTISLMAIAIGIGTSHIHDALDQALGEMEGAFPNIPFKRFKPIACALIGAVVAAFYALMCSRER